MMERNRNSNFFGEMMIYSSFALLVDSPIAFGILLLIWGSVFVSRIVLKENSLAKKPGYEEYRKKSYLLIYKIFSNDFLNLAFYGFAICLVIFIYQNGGLELTKRKIFG